MGRIETNTVPFFTSARVSGWRARSMSLDALVLSANPLAAAHATMTAIITLLFSDRLICVPSCLLVYRVHIEFFAIVALRVVHVV